MVDDLFVTTKSLNADGTATLGVTGTIENSGNKDLAATLDLKINPRQLLREKHARITLGKH